MPYRLLRVALAISMVLVSAPNPSLLAAERPGASRAPLSPIKCEDLRLDRGGLLQGQLLNTQGRAVAGAKVWLVGGNGASVFAKTNRQGRYAFKSVRSGVYYIGAGKSIRKCRVWSSKAAPPKSLAGIMIVADEATLRAQMGPPTMLNGLVQRSKNFFAHPVGMITLGAAIATPIALIAADGDDPPASP